MSQDDFIVYDEQIKYIDFAADMKWQYCLIDANWDQKIGYEKVKELEKISYIFSSVKGLIIYSEEISQKSNPQIIETKK